MSKERRSLQDDNNADGLIGTCYQQTQQGGNADLPLCRQRTAPRAFRKTRLRIPVRTSQAITALARAQSYGCREPLVASTDRLQLPTVLVPSDSLDCGLVIVSPASVRL